MFDYSPLAIKDVLVISPKVFSDERGFFFESFNKVCFVKIVGSKSNFIQDNHSKSCYGVLRGLHSQNSPLEQAKLIRVSKGKIFDVAVDIRKNSLTYGQWVSEILSEENKKQLWIPEGFAHGFLTLSDYAEVQYKTNNYYSPGCEISIDPFDKDISIKWPKISCDYILSDKDKGGLDFKAL